MRDVDLDRRVLGLKSTRAMMLYTSTVPICTDRTLSFLRKDRDMRHLRHLGNPDIAKYLLANRAFVDFQYNESFSRRYAMRPVARPSKNKRNPWKMSR